MTRAVVTILLSGLLLAAAQPAGAYSFIDRAYGTPELGLSPRSRAMGGAGIAMGNGAYSLVDNPAALVLSGGNGIQLQGYLSRASENRFLPLFDTFDSFVDENAIAVNDNTYGGVQGGFTLDRWGDRGIVVAAGIFNRYDPRYDYFDELRTSDLDDAIINNRIIRTEGMLRAATVGAAIPLGTDGSGLGVAVNYYFGTFTDRTVTVEDPTHFDSSVSNDEKLERKLSGASVTVGAVAYVNERLTVGAAVETAPKLNNDYTRWFDGSVTSAEESSGNLDLPVRYQGGATYRPRNTFETTFALDVIYTPWSDLKDDLAPDQDLEDTWDVRFGLEHVFYNGLPGRIGFRYAESYALDEADRATFTFGFGYVLDMLTVDISGEVGKWVTRQEPIRPRDEESSAVGLGRDRVEDTLVRVFLGVDYAF